MPDCHQRLLTPVLRGYGALFARLMILPFGRASSFRRKALRLFFDDFGLGGKAGRSQPPMARCRFGVSNLCQFATSPPPSLGDRSGCGLDDQLSNLLQPTVWNRRTAEGAAPKSWDREVKKPNLEQPLMIGGTSFRLLSPSQSVAATYPLY